MKEIDKEEYKAVSRRPVNRAYNSHGYDEICDKLGCLQRAQAQTRGQVQNLTEITNLICRILQVRGQVEELLLEQTLGTTSTSAK
jgi:hypothetical protein